MSGQIFVPTPVRIPARTLTPVHIPDLARTRQGRIRILGRGRIPILPDHRRTHIPTTLVIGRAPTTQAITGAPR